MELKNSIWAPSYVYLIFFDQEPNSYSFALDYIGMRRRGGTTTLAMEVFSRRRWTTVLAQQSNMNGMMPCIYWIIFGVWHKHNSLQLGPMQPSSPTTKKLLAIDLSTHWRDSGLFSANHFKKHDSNSLASVRCRRLINLTSLPNYMWSPHVGSS